MQYCTSTCWRRPASADFFNRPLAAGGAAHRLSAICPRLDGSEPAFADQRGEHGGCRLAEQAAPLAVYGYRATGFPQHRQVCVEGDAHTETGLGGDGLLAVRRECDRAAVAGGQQRFGDGRGAGTVDVDNLAKNGLHAALRVEDSAGAGLEAVDVVLSDIGLDLPALRIDEDAERGARTDPHAGLQLSVGIEPEAGEAGAQREAPQFVGGGAQLGDLLVEASGGDAGLLDAALLRLQAGQLHVEGAQAGLVAQAAQAQVGGV